MNTTPKICSLVGVAVILSSCGLAETGPSDDTIIEGIDFHYKQGNPTTIDNVWMSGQLFIRKKFAIQNSYTRDIDGEKVHFVDLIVSGDYLRGERENVTPHCEAIALEFVKRGNSWYFSDNPERKQEKLQDCQMPSSAKTIPPDHAGSAAQMQAHRNSADKPTPTPQR